MGASTRDAPAPSDDARRWERLLQWLKDVHGMDTGPDAFLVEAREVHGESGNILSCRKAEHTLKALEEDFSPVRRALYDSHLLIRL